MTIDLYMHPMSSPCRAVLITAEQLGIKFNKKIVDVLTGEQFTPEYMKINPQHCVPTINDDGFFLWESRAILKYLVNQYAPNSLLYPKNPKIRATVDRLLYFDIDVLYKAQQEVLYPTISKGETADSEKQEAYKKALEYLEMFLSKTAYVAGNSVTIADYSILASITSTEVIEYNFSPFPKITAWMKKLKLEIPSYEEINEVPLKKFKKIIDYS